MSLPTASDTSDREIVVTRTFNAPRELVYQVFTEPQHVPHWWGPRGFTLTTQEMNVRVGGVWRFVMHGPDGTDYDNTIAYREIKRPSLLVYSHSGNADDPVQFVTTVTLEEVDRIKTKVTLRAVFDRPEARANAVKSHHAIEGGQQTMDRLGERLISLDTAPGSIVTSRVFAASPEQVYAAFSDPRQLAQWWGPKDFTNTFTTFDLRPGGAWIFTMHGPDGANYPNESEFVEVVPNERIVFHHYRMMHWFKMTMTFAAQPGGQTKLTWQMQFGSTEENDQIRRGVTEGNNDNYDRLAAHLARQCELTATVHPDTPGTHELVISRVFAAPRELVWEAWTNPKHAVNWWGPNGFSATIHEMDLRPGGVWRQTLHGPDGTDYANLSTFREVVKPERIVYDHGGGKAGAPGVQFVATWTFETVAPGKTRLTLRQVFPTAEMREIIVKTYGALEGAKQTLSRLADYLPKLAAK